MVWGYKVSVRQIFYFKEVEVITPHVAFVSFQLYGQMSFLQDLYII